MKTPKTLFPFVLGLFVLLSCGNETNPRNNGDRDPSTDKNSSNSAAYSGEISGVNASGRCSFEDNRNVGGVLGMSCEFQSGQFGYTFNAEMFNTTQGFADMTETPTGSRVRIQVDWSEASYPPSGFQMTVNPFGAPTFYQFTRN